eukprot:TRINITY_DN45578_c0_g1_i1.p1 TRINITY_DN45578_c0_g1~~TRINITY_DN45578_c0_g1_i1.p1  ORF type:complete len:311 (-),score=52.10 TRINITY_DN45578_c0_g1_i1:45-977(-)
MAAGVAGVLARYEVGDLPLPKELFFLEHPKHTLFDAIHFLSDHHVSCAPVLGEDGGLMGVVDASTIVSYVVRSATKGSLELKDSPFTDLLLRATPITVVNRNARLDYISDALAGPSRRAMVIGSYGSPPDSIVTQFTLLQFLWSKKEELKQSLIGKVMDLCTPSAITIEDRDSALAAFEVMHAKHVSSLPVLDSDGLVFSVISATDLVIGLAHMLDKTQALATLKASSVLEFISANRSLDLHARAPSIIVYADTPLESVFGKLVASHVHRVVVCTSDRKPLGVLSLTDICRAASGSPRTGNVSGAAAGGS